MIKLPENLNFDDFWEQIDKEKNEVCPKCENLGYYFVENSMCGDIYSKYEYTPCSCRYAYSYKKEKELSFKNNDENNIMVPYSFIIKASSLLYLVGERGKVVVDDDIRQELIKCASNLKKIYMNEKGE